MCSASFINTTNVGDRGWEPPLVDEDLQAICQVIYKGVEGAEWENLYHKFVEMKEGSRNVRHHSRSSRAKTLWKIRDAKERGDEYHDQTSEQKIVNRVAVCGQNTC